MAGLPNILRARWKIFLYHHNRLLSNPDPARAQRKFESRIARSRRVGLVRGVFFVGLYFSFVAAGLGFVLDYLDVAVAQTVLQALKTVFSSLTVIFVAGIFVCTRVLNYLEVDLYYFSQEARMRPGEA